MPLFPITPRWLKEDPFHPIYPSNLDQNANWILVHLGCYFTKPKIEEETQNSEICSRKPYTVSVLWQEEGYTGKYSLSTRQIPRADSNGFPEGSGYISPYIPTWVIIQTFSISKSYTSSIVLPGRAILKELILRIGLEAGAIFSRIAQYMKQYGSV